MLDVKEWYSVVKQMSNDITRMDVVWYFVMDFSSDEIAAAEEFLTKKHGWCPQIYKLSEVPWMRLLTHLNTKGYSL